MRAREMKNYPNEKIYHPQYVLVSRVIDRIATEVDISKYFTFAFVRNPYDRAVSSWKFGDYHADWNCDFTEFCKTLKTIETNPKETFFWGGFPKSLFSNYSRRQIAGLINHSCDQYPLIFGKNASVNFVGRFENLQQDFDTLCDKVGIKRQKLPHKNKTKHKHYTEYYDDETRQIIAEKYAKDIEYFGYEFGE
tara:strand:+ start:119 stop:697 length:579 start_codon:yes stop_codon:yes gene_type:complete